MVQGYPTGFVDRSGHLGRLALREPGPSLPLNKMCRYKICGCPSIGHEDYCCLGCDAVQFGT